MKHELIVSPISKLCHDLLHRNRTVQSNNFSNLFDQFIFHNDFLKKFIADHRPTENQITFMRAVSIQGIFHDKNFPEIGTFTTDTPDNIRFEPVKNKNLLEISRACLHDLLLQVTDPKNTDLNRLVAAELKIVEDEIFRIDEILKKVPEILAKNLTGGIKKLTKKPKVSVITVSYNLASLVEETMRSIHNQNYDDFEHIVIDAASKDGSLELIKKYPNIILLSEKDTGYPDGFWKGVRLAQGDYIMQCCISDGYANLDWIRKCAEALDQNADVSMVWGIPWGIDKNSQIIDARFTDFDYTEAPQREDMFNYWMRTGVSAVETNLCVKREVLLKCYPTLEETKKDILDWQEFTFRFHSLGYLSLHIPVIANFSHVDHEGKMGLELRKSGKYKRMLDTYQNNMRNYKRSLMLGTHRHQFIDSHENVLPMTVDRTRLIIDHVKELLKQNKKYIDPRKYLAYIRKLW